MNCKYCGKEFFKKGNLCCSRSCAAKLSNQSGYHKESFVCLNCGKEYTPKTPDRNKYCSRECAFEHKRAKPIIKTKPICVICGKEFNGRINSKYCSKKCSNIKGLKDYYLNKDKYLKQKRDKYIPVKIVYEDRTCIECGNTFKVNIKINKKYCSYKCSIKEQKRNENHKRRMVKKEQFVEKVFRHEIYKRDGGYCQICHSKKKIDLKLKAPHPLSATLDHIIPLAKGGTHEPSNCQLAHFICNSKKSDKLLDGQFKLAF
jgi:5-methylcytosine-specific restriction endonuclease McrA